MMIKEIVKWKPLLIGVVIAVGLYIVSDLIAGVSILLPGLLMAGIIVGFMINGDIKSGAINGTILGVISALIVNFILIAMIYMQGYGAYVMTILSSYALYAVLEVVLGAVGGVLGSLIRSESFENNN